MFLNLVAAKAPLFKLTTRAETVAFFVFTAENFLCKNTSSHGTAETQAIQTA